MRLLHPTMILPFLILLAAPSAQALPDESLKNSVVKIFTISKSPDYYQPWNVNPQDSSSGSGCILSGNRILTNAHVVSDAVFLQVLKVGDTQRYTARVEYVGHDCEVAILSVEDPDFFKGTRPVVFGGIPDQRDKVAAYGFPIGGNELSITEGVVSRVEVQPYVHAYSELLAIQIDAAINAGNSGGPVFKDGKFVGISFQSFSGSGAAENIGYIVPVPVVNRFFQDITDGKYDGVPSLGIYYEKMENDALREFYRMKKGQTGVLITRVIWGSSVDGTVKPGDVLLAVDDVAIANDGSVPFRRKERLNFGYLVDRHLMGEKMTMRILRDGAERTLSFPLKSVDPLVPRPRYDTLPTYYVIGGIVFTPLTYNYLVTRNVRMDSPPKFRYMLECLTATEDQRQVVVLNQVMPHDVNVGYHEVQHDIVESVNGKSIRDMKDLVEAFEKNEGPYHVIRLDSLQNNGEIVILDAKRTAKAGPEILKRYGIPSDRSEDLKDAPRP